MINPSMMDTNIGVRYAIKQKILNGPKHLGATELKVDQTKIQREKQNLWLPKLYFAESFLLSNRASVKIVVGRRKIIIMKVTSLNIG